MSNVINTEGANAAKGKCQTLVNHMYGVSRDTSLGLES